MSEYQFVKFRAIDHPLTDKQLVFMDRQSTRAEFTKWEFEVEYHFSSFGGDVDGMLRNGYDIYLNYSNYGCREIRLRLPNGLPFPKITWSMYLKVNGLTWKSDRNGKAGILSVEPYLEEADEDGLELDDYLDAAALLRELLIAGDLRALYVLWLCCTMDANQDTGEWMEPPVPHGLGAISENVKDLLEFFDVAPLLVDAAANGIPTTFPNPSQSDSYQAWISSLAEARRTLIIERLLAEDPVVLKSELLAEIRDNQSVTQWPCQPPIRTVTDLLAVCAGLREQEEAKQRSAALAKAKHESVKAEKQRQARMKEMKTLPAPWLAKVTKLVEQRGTDNYQEAASILFDLREALGGNEGDRIARRHAAHLATKHPTLKMLKSSLRKQHLID